MCGGLPQSLVGFRGPLIQEMRARGFAVTACANGTDPDTSATLEGWGVDYVPLPLSRAGFSPVGDLVYLANLIQLARRVKPDVIFGYTHKPVIFSAIAGRIASAPVRGGWVTGLGYAFVDSGGWKQKFARFFLCQLYRFSLRFNTSLLFQNSDDLSEFRERNLLPESLSVGLTRGSGVDLKDYPAKDLPTGPPRLLLIARLLADKGIREYAEAIRIVKETHPELEADLVGPFDPNPSAVREAEIESWEAERLLEYHGSIRDVRPYLEKCTIFVLPSYYREGTPRTILEAMATGRPIVTADTPGCRETVEAGRNGLLVKPRDPIALAQAITNLIENPKNIVQMAIESRAMAETQFDVAMVNRAVLSSLRLDRHLQNPPNLQPN